MPHLPAGPGWGAVVGDCRRDRAGRMCSGMWLRVANCAQRAIEQRESDGAVLSGNWTGSEEIYSQTASAVVGQGTAGSSNKESGGNSCSVDKAYANGKGVTGVHLKARHLFIA